MAVGTSCALLGGCALSPTGQPWLSSQLLHLQPRVRRVWARSFFLTNPLSAAVCLMMGWRDCRGEAALIHSSPAGVQVDRLMLLFWASPHPILVLCWGKTLTGEVWELVWLCWSSFPLQHPRDPLPSLTHPLSSLALLLSDNRQRERSAAGSPHRDFG